MKTFSSTSTLLGWMAFIAPSSKSSTNAGTVFFQNVDSSSVLGSSISYENVAHKDAALSSYAHTPSPEHDLVKAFQMASLSTPLTLDDLPAIPQMTGGYPGVAILDYDGDGDLDIFVSNGPGSANSLFHNQLQETGKMNFTNVAVMAGVAATEQDSAGVCFGDMDNDGDHDLVVLGRNDSNKFFENQGNGTFREVETSGIQGGGPSYRWSTSCAVGDVDGDGLLDIFVSNSADTTNSSFIYTTPYAFNEHNQLFHNNGDLTFTDISQSSGVENIKGITVEGSPTVTWSCAMVDVDLDGDIDVVFTDDQVGIPREVDGGSDTGLVHVMVNDGTGFFEDHPVALDDDKTGQWMGLDFGDLNCDGKLDMFVTNFGDYQPTVFGGNPGENLGRSASRWFLGNGDGTFQDPKVGGIIATPFGWGNAIFDYDNDGDQDIIFHGGLDATTLVAADNPGAILRNDACAARFTVDKDAIPDDATCTDAQDGQPIPGCTEHIRRNVRGMAVGDLNGDGFVDIVTTANVIYPKSLPLLPATDQYGSDFDDSAFFMTPFALGEDGGMTWMEKENLPGDVAVEVSSGNENESVTITAVGSIGIASEAHTNRDGIGAVISFRASKDGPVVMTAVTGGASHLSQHSLERTFGLGNDKKTSSSTKRTRKEKYMVEILWPGGVRNRLYSVKRGRVVFPEIPCSFDDDGFEKKGKFLQCVRQSLEELNNAGVINLREKNRFMKSMRKAWKDARRE